MINNRARRPSGTVEILDWFLAADLTRTNQPGTLNGPYGTGIALRTSPGNSCQATLIQSLRDTAYATLYLSGLWALTGRCQDVETLLRRVSSRQHPYSESPGHAPA
jgi:hypothetical protein